MQIINAMHSEFPFYSNKEVISHIHIIIGLNLKLELLVYA